MKRHIETTRRSLSDLDGLSKETEASERSLLERAHQRLQEVDAALARHRPGLESAPDSFQDRYEALTRERGDLHLVIAKANKALGQ